MSNGARRAPKRSTALTLCGYCWLRPKEPRSLWCFSVLGSGEQPHVRDNSVLRQAGARRAAQARRMREGGKGGKGRAWGEGAHIW